MKSANRKSRYSQRDEDETTAACVDGDVPGRTIRTAYDGVQTAVAGRRSSAGQEIGCGGLSRESDDRTFTPSELSARAGNVLKELAVELTGEHPPHGEWVPSDQLLHKLTYRNLSTARNCGPLTTAEIIRWAEARGKIIRPSFHTGKSLSAMWQEAIEKFPAGEISKVEVVEALENSARRRNTRIPVEFQKILLQLVESSGE